MKKKWKLNSNLFLNTNKKKWQKHYYKLNWNYNENI